MSTNQYLGGKVIDSGGSANMGADLYSRIVNVQNVNSIGIQYTIDNNGTTSAGTLYIQGSIDGSTWVNLDAFSGSSSTAIASSTDYEDILNLGSRPYGWVRIFFDYSSGTGGIMDAWINRNMN